MAWAGQTGSAGRMTALKGVAKFIPVTSGELSGSLSSKVFPSDLLFLFPDGTMRRSDGTATLANLPVVADKVLVDIEKSWLNAANNNGAYQLAANGVIVADSTGQIADEALKPVEQWDSDGQGTMVPHIKESYLQKYVDPSTHQLRLSALPDSVRAGLIFKAAYADLASATDEDKKHLVFVADASGDSTVTSGWAVYAWTTNQWTKVSEGEGLDIDVAAIECSHANIEAEGGVCFDHSVMLGMSLTEMDAAITAAAGA